MSSWFLYSGVVLFVEILLWGALAVWIALGAFHVWNLWGVTVLGPEDTHEALAHTPKVSVVAAARNEEDRLNEFLSSALALDYPDYEVILVDDDSTDGTAAIAESWAARPEAGRGRLIVVHNRELPPGWRGKVWALNLAVERARGEWLLATDADVVFHPSALRVALQQAQARGSQFISVTPDLEFQGFWERVVLPAFSLLLGTLYPIRLVNRAASRQAIAAGAFILMRRDDFQAVGGYEAVRGTLIEDLRLAQLFKGSGRRTFLATGHGLVRTRMYQTAGEMWESLARSAFEGSGFSLATISAGVVASAWIALLPWAVAFGLAARRLAGPASGSDPTFLLAIAACAAGSLVYLPWVRFLRAPAIYSLTLPLAVLFYSGVSLDSARLNLMGHGALWKGRRYRPPA
jgi:chlorobactene glucosyltransferase